MIFFLTLKPTPVQKSRSEINQCDLSDLVHFYCEWGSIAVIFVILFNIYVCLKYCMLLKTQWTLLLF